MWSLVRIQSPRLKKRLDNQLIVEPFSFSEGRLGKGFRPRFYGILRRVCKPWCKPPKGYGRYNFSHLLQKQDPRQRGASAHVAHYKGPQTDDEEFGRVGPSVKLGFRPQRAQAQVSRPQVYPADYPEGQDRVSNQAVGEKRQ